MATVAAAQGRRCRCGDRRAADRSHRTSITVPTAAAFATYAGVAPIEVASGERTRHRLSRAGDRQLNSAIHLIAVTQVRMRKSRGRCYCDTKIAEGKTRNEAMRCLKRRLANHLWRLMIADERRLGRSTQNNDIAS